MNNYEIISVQITFATGSSMSFTLGEIGHTPYSNSAVETLTLSADDSIVVGFADGSLLEYCGQQFVIHWSPTA